MLQQCYYQTLVHRGNDIGRNIRYDFICIYRLLKDICNVLLEFFFPHSLIEQSGLPSSDILKLLL